MKHISLCFLFLHVSNASFFYSGVIGRKEDFTSIDKRTVHHYSSLAVDIAETVIRALARIVFIEDSMTSLKVWLTRFFYIPLCVMPLIRNNV